MSSTIDSLLNTYEDFGVRLGLERIGFLLDYLGNPQQKTPLIHVTGTNGKGSVCAYISSVLTKTVYKVGRYTSPHLVHWTERICINDQPISERELINILEEIKIYTDKIIEQSGDCPTQFEVLTAAAWFYFAKEQVDVAIIEVGIGGRLDSTNVCQPPLMSIITSIGFDHVKELGNTLVDIAWEKAGILKANRPAILGEIPSEALSPIQEKLAQLNCPATWVKPAISCEKSGQNWAVYNEIEYPLALTGRVQLLNSALAIAALQELQKQGWKISLEAIKEGMRKVVWSGRLQWTNWRGKPLLIDGAHNPAGAAYLRDYADSLKKPILWILGMVSNKDHQKILQLLLKSGDSLYLVPFPVADYLRVEPEELAIAAQQICPNLTQIKCFSELTLALDEAMTETNGKYTPILGGSLYLIGHFFSVALVTKP